MLLLCNNTVGISNTPQAVPTPLARAPSPCPCTLSSGSKKSCSALESFAQTSPDFCQALGSCPLLLADRKSREKQVVYQLDKLAGVRTRFGAGGLHRSGLWGHKCWELSIHMAPYPSPQPTQLPSCQRDD